MERGIGFANYSLGWDVRAVERYRQKTVRGMNREWRGEGSWEERSWWHGAHRHAEGERE